jgi:hypothetical protein
LILSFSLIGCTTGSKTKTNLNYYSYNNIQPEPESVVIYKEPEPVVIYKEKIVPVETIKYKTIYRNVPPQDVTMADLGGEIGKKLLRKMQAAYNEN